MASAWVMLGQSSRSAAVRTSCFLRRKGGVSSGSCGAVINLFHRAQLSSTGTRQQQEAMTFSSPLVTAEELKGALATSHEKIRCVDASWHLSGDRDAKQEFLDGHLPGAVFFDIDEITDETQSLPHMIPSEDVFAARVSELGISNEHTVVVYVKQGSFSAPRCWWTFRAFGHEGVHILDGGFPAWEASGGRVEKGETNPTSTRPPSGLVQASGNMWKLKQKGFQAQLNAPMLRTWRQVLSQVEQGKEEAGQIVDARSLERFRGEAPEPRAGVAAGHMPGSVSLPFTKVLEEGDVTKFLPPDEIRKAFEDAGVDIDSPLSVTTTCGSGVTAATLTFALELVGRKAERSPLYDGSWTEWGSKDDLPRATGKD